MINIIIQLILIINHALRTMLSYVIELPNRVLISILSNHRCNKCLDSLYNAGFFVLSVFSKWLDRLVLGVDNLASLIPSVCIDLCESIVRHCITLADFVFNELMFSVLESIVLLIDYVSKPVVKFISIYINSLSGLRFFSYLDYGLCKVFAFLESTICNVLGVADDIISPELLKDIALFIIGLILNPVSGLVLSVVIPGMLSRYLYSLAICFSILLPLGLIDIYQSCSKLNSVDAARYAAKTSAEVIYSAFSLSVAMSILPELVLVI